MPRVIYVDSNQTVIESYSIVPDRYGGGRVAASHLKEVLNKDGWEFWIYSNPQSFVAARKNAANENTYCLRDLDDEKRARLREGECILSVIPEAGEFDLLMTGNATEFVNTENTNLKTLVWSVGYSENVHRKNKNVAFYNLERQKPNFTHNGHSIFHVILGNPVPAFQEYQKEDYLLYIGRICSVFLIRELIVSCQRGNIPLVLGGKIDSEYSIDDLVDGKLIKYIGAVEQDKKIELLKKARGIPLLTNWSCPFSLNLVESQLYGVPVLASNIGFLQDYVLNGFNGFHVSNDNELKQAYDLLSNIPQLNCYTAGSIYNLNSMIYTFKQVIERVLA